LSEIDSGPANKLMRRALPQMPQAGPRLENGCRRDSMLGAKASPTPRWNDPHQRPSELGMPKLAGKMSFHLVRRACVQACTSSIARRGGRARKPASGFDVGRVRMNHVSYSASTQTSAVRNAPSHNRRTKRHARARRREILSGNLMHGLPKRPVFSSFFGCVLPQRFSR